MALPVVVGHATVASVCFSSASSPPPLLLALLAWGAGRPPCWRTSGSSVGWGVCVGAGAFLCVCCLGVWCGPCLLGAPLRAVRGCAGSCGCLACVFGCCCGVWRVALLAGALCVRGRVCAGCVVCAPWVWFVRVVCAGCVLRPGRAPWCSGFVVLWVCLVWVVLFSLGSPAWFVCVCGARSGSGPFPCAALARC